MRKVSFRQPPVRLFWALTMLLVMMLFPSIVDAQSTPIFSKIGSGPVLASSESWEGKQIEAITVIFDGQYKAWYAAGTDKPLPSGGVAPIDQIGYATSSDGITWTKYAGNPVLSASFTTDLNGQPFNGISVAYPSIVKVGTAYFLYYRETDGHGKYFIGWAISNDGISWTKSSTPILSGTLPDVVYANGQWHMWYSIESNAGEDWLRYEF